MQGTYYWNGTTFPTIGGKPTLVAYSNFSDCCCGKCSYCGDEATPANYTVTFADILQCSDDQPHAINGTAILLSRPTSTSCSWIGTSGAVIAMLTLRGPDADFTWDISATDAGRKIFDFTHAGDLPGFAGLCNDDLGNQNNALVQGDCLGTPGTNGYGGTASILVGDQT